MIAKINKDASEINSFLVFQVGVTVGVLRLFIFLPIIQIIFSPRQLFLSEHMSIT